MPDGASIVALHPSTARAATEAPAAASGAQPASAFEAAKAAMQRSIEDFAEGRTDLFTVLASADMIAEQHKVRSADLRGWAKQQMDTLRARTADKSRVPALSCATDPEPRAQPDSFVKVLDMIARAVAARVVVSQEANTAVALWCAGTWGINPPSGADGPDIFPRLRLHSPVKRCGKSTLLEVVQHVVRRPQAATDTSEAALFAQSRNTTRRS